MKDGNFFRNSYKFKNNLTNFIRRYRLSIIILCCFFLVGFIAGIFTASNYSGSLELENIPDSNLVSFLCGDKSSFGLFFSYLIGLLIIIILILFCNVNFFCSIINIAYILIRGYSLGFTIFAIVMLYSFAGIINVVVLIIPFWILINFVLILISAICVSKNHIIKKYGRHCYISNSPRSFIVLMCIVLVSLLFLFCMLTPIIKITIIVN